MTRFDLGKTQKGDNIYLEQIQEGLWVTGGFVNAKFITVIPTAEDDDITYKLFYIEDLEPILIGTTLPMQETVTSIIFENGRYVFKTNKYKDNE